MPSGDTANRGLTLQHRIGPDEQKRCLGPAEGNVVQADEVLERPFQSGALQSQGTKVGSVGGQMVFHHRHARRILRKSAESIPRVVASELSADIHDDQREFETLGLMDRHHGQPIPGYLWHDFLVDLYHVVRDGDEDISKYRVATAGPMRFVPQQAPTISREGGSLGCGPADGLQIYLTFRVVLEEGEERRRP